MYISRKSTEIEQKPSGEQAKILHWLRDRISPNCWGSSNADKTGLGFCNTKAEIARFYDGLRRNRRAPMHKITLMAMYKHMIQDADWMMYFTAIGSKKAIETLGMIDIDCHNSGTVEDAIACVEWLKHNGFPGLFYSVSTNGRGVHAYFRVCKVQEDAESLGEAMKGLERWLRLQLEIQGWGIEGIEIKGRPMVIRWGPEQYEVDSITFGTLAKLPIEALDRPEELMNTTLMSVDQMRRLGDQERRHREQVVQTAGCADGACAVPAQGLSDTFGFQELDIASLLPVSDEVEVGLRERRELTTYSPPPKHDFLPSMRDREWPHFIMYIARNGVVEPDKLGTYLHELAKWLIWVELHHLPEVERNEKASGLLDFLVTHKNNGNITRMEEGLGHQVDQQVRRCVVCADDISDHGKEVMAKIRAKRKSGKYKQVFYVEPLLGRVEGVREEEGLREKRGLTTYSPPLKHKPLPLEIEVKLDQVARDKKMRRKPGQDYPFVQFARKMLNAVWDNKGSARLGWETLVSMTNTSKPEQQVEYKRLLRDAGLLQDWEGSYRRHRATMLYRLTQDALGAFQREFRQKTQAIRA